ncbi:DUF7538 family protein [Halovenus carboxidivorans]|uniref:DUF7538 family protein n=1 Tax=Halovenus carboxidivorans TaxID=2692199 RepID=UPI001F363A38|nr:hypothetical protein [Halovenus carboxidivorans]
MDEADNSDSPESPGVPAEESADPEADPLEGLAAREGWRVEGSAARVHYSGATDRYSIEYYAPSDCTLYWKVPPEDAGETAVPVGRETVPDPLRERIREDLAAAGIDPAVDDRSL